MMKNGGEDGDDEDMEEMEVGGGLMNGDAEHNGKETESSSKASNAPPPWVEELKMSQAKKSLQQQQG